jgi:hypothetical protein
VCWRGLVEGASRWRKKPKPKKKKEKRKKKNHVRTFISAALSMPLTASVGLTAAASNSVAAVMRGENTRGIVCARARMASVCVWWRRRCCEARGRGAKESDVFCVNANLSVFLPAAFKVHLPRPGFPPFWTLVKESSCASDRQNNTARDGDEIDSCFFFIGVPTKTKLSHSSTLLC